ncbi:MAG TPA: DUF3108 domain-containing protein [bacterium]|nr:DUF3108 domain-containing protein [bacterium]HPG45957.1 DUF3108 domain-containing protein [bacterium]HPM97779.1 DUF3108 domain-containing protein [bacterium]
MHSFKWLFAVVALVVVAVFFTLSLRAYQSEADEQLTTGVPDSALSQRGSALQARLSSAIEPSVPARRVAPLEFVYSPWMRRLQQNAFQVGEKLVYKVKYGIITAGEAELAIPTISQFNGHSVFEITSRIQTASTFNRIFRVDDLVRSLVDEQGIFSWYIEEHLREGKYNADRWIILNHQVGLAYNARDTVAIAPFTQDVLSIIYFIRSQPLKSGAVIETENIINMKRYPVDVHILGQERVNVKAGDFNCFQVEPRYRPGFDKKPKGEMKLWVSNDQRKLPIRIITSTPFGSLKMELESTSGLIGLAAADTD